MADFIICYDLCRTFVSWFVMSGVASPYGAQRCSYDTLVYVPTKRAQGRGLETIMSLKSLKNNNAPVAQVDRAVDS